MSECLVVHFNQDEFFYVMIREFQTIRCWVTRRCLAARWKKGFNMQYCLACRGWCTPKMSDGDVLPGRHVLIAFHLFHPSTEAYVGWVPYSYVISQHKPTWAILHTVGPSRNALHVDYRSGTLRLLHAGIDINCSHHSRSLLRCGLFTFEWKIRLLSTVIHVKKMSIYVPL